MKFRSWVGAMRLRTLPLSLSCIGMGSFLAAGIDAFRWDVFLLCVWTTILLQILSNLANDYGDTVHGADHADRQGPSRAVQSGVISATAMRTAVILVSVLTFVSGIVLLMVSLGLDVRAFVFFLALGGLSIAAAITYTAGRKPYGYAGLGDLSVFIFFGLVGVMGSNYLFTRSLDVLLVLPAMSCGFFSIGVLNVNNIRDIESDRKAGKWSIPVRIGRENAIKYHWFLLGGGLLTALVFTGMMYRSPLQFLFLLTTPLFVRNAMAVSTLPSDRLDPWLKQLAISTLLFVLLFGTGHLVG